MIALLVPVLTAAAPMPQAVDIPFERFELDNGLQVVVHEDHSDPVVAIFVVYHVGSGREEPGRSGFAHLFEHIMFQGSQNVGDEEHFKFVSEAGGTLNGTTNTDRTNYFETLPSNQLELGLWLEADRMGFLLPAVNQEKLDRQRDVVKNERRQNYENRPYGRVRGAVAAALYPPDHPYSWLTIGSHEDLSAASLEDVQSFFRRWYGPNNATLAIGGDVDLEQVRTLVTKWFGPIPRGPEVEAPEPRPVTLDRTKRIVIEDRVKLPQLTTTWPTVAAEHADEAALNMLGRILSANKSAVLDRALTVESTLASSVSAYHRGTELAGTFTITLRPSPGNSLDTLAETQDKLLKALAETGVDPEHLQRVKNRYESDFLRRLETVSAKTSALAEYNTFLGHPNGFEDELQRHLAVTPADIARVLERYLIDRPAVLVSVVPEGEPQLALSEPAFRAPEAIPDPERAKRPSPGPAPVFRAPEVWHAQNASGVSIVGTRYSELPLVQLSLSVPAGRVHETPVSLGLASLTAEMLLEGTASMSSTELTEALDAVGASLSASAGEDEVQISLSCLEKHLPKAIEILTEVVLKPRFDEGDFARRKKQRLTSIQTRADRASTIASDVFNRLMRGDPVLGRPSVGTTASVAELAVSDVRAFWREHAVPNGARMTYVGGLDADGIEQHFGPMFQAWAEQSSSSRADAPALTYGDAVGRPGRIYLVDKPGAAQSEIRIGHPSVASTDPDFYPLFVLNYVLGGSFNSRINLNLREDKGWAYGARSRFSGGRRPGAFYASGGIQTDHTADAVEEFLKELKHIHNGVTEEELAYAQSALEQAATRQYESMRAQLSMLENISRYGYPDDYIEERIQITRDLDRERLAALADKHLRFDDLIVLVVGDKERVLGELEALEIGPVIELDVSGSLATGNAPEVGSAGGTKVR